MMTIPTQAASGLRPAWKDVLSGSTAPAVALAVVAFLLVTLDTELIEAVPEVVVAMLAASVAALYRTQASSCLGGADRVSACKEWVADDADDYVTSLEDPCGSAGTPIRARGARGGLKSKKKRAKAGNRGKWISFDDRVLMCAKFVFEGYPEESTTEEDSPSDGMPKCSSTEGSVQDTPSEDSE
mmetsp:Transcript_10073/g.22217  ORF Transcript_10073/g.22217 Transcript_10073/m.22217 type:complete len:184 (+) Transcript_10073:198-749(+)|eukprot:CAMPEP_0204276188 /NCGR_PEP_ID=MMETSP0468-20130131/27556_1 /ASSEMBLY_ACC=CAM_ASM_000383 /TAXON_ID=2969 /ORGANISM="Oxyrrhis marina" /LENGTH=183 /DNA_ID=CAMNT_0051252723 /DNA_START=188 /DNA_END=739 /DNA_ORIENTATION=+